MRVLGLDLGEKHIGVAISDELLITALGLDTIKRKDLISDLQRLEYLIDRFHIDEIVVGLPLNMDGSKSESAEGILKFSKLIGERFDIKVNTWDERLTSAQAEKALLEGDLSRKKRKSLSDRLAAQLILQGYLDRDRRSTA